MTFLAGFAAGFVTGGAAATAALVGLAVQWGRFDERNLYDADVVDWCDECGVVHRLRAPCPMDDVPTPKEAQ